MEESHRRVGEKVMGYLVTRSLILPELRAHLTELKHEASGARVLHVACDDPENLFCLSFPTYPTSSNGAPHILEHVVLCGSRKFPVKDPFFCMTRRSLATFMNAFTGADFTCYPASSQVEQDFYNLLEVYLDAVFHPLITEESFAQEGHRLELSDEGSHLLHKGIVYNEMKGSLSSPDNRLWHALMAALCPDLTYAHNSGGDPAEIPSLSYKELLEFYETYYHPSRCLFFFYGNLPLEKHLAFLNERALKGVLPAAPLSLPRQKRRSAPIATKALYPSQDGEQDSEGELDRQHYVAIGWLTVAASEQEELLALNLLDSILMDTDASPLKAALQKSKLCVQADSAIDPEMSEVPFVVVCKGCRKEDAEALEQLLLAELAKIASAPLDPELVESSLHQLELARTEVGGGHGPFGLTLFFRAALGVQHGTEPERALLVQSLFEQLRRRLEDPLYLPQVLERQLLNNTHRVRLLLSPDPSLHQREERTEKEALEKLRRSLSKEQLKSLEEKKEHLETIRQEAAEQSLDCLPIMPLSQVPKEVRTIAVTRLQQGAVEVLHHECFTGGVVYLELISDLPPIAQEHLPYLTLLLELSSELGCAGRSYEEQLKLLHRVTGGAGLALHWHTPLSTPQLLPTWGVRGKAMGRHGLDLARILEELRAGVRLDEEERIEELLQEMRTNAQTGLARKGMRYASGLAMSNLSQLSWVQERLGGFTFYQWLMEKTKKLSETLPEILRELKKVQEIMLKGARRKLIITCEAPVLGELLNSHFAGLCGLHDATPPPPQEAWPLIPLPSETSALSAVIPSPVAFLCQGFKTVGYLHPDAPALSLATQLLEHLVLHPKIREEGGAYGSSASYATSTGCFSLQAYRDPHIARTLDAFQQALQRVAATQFKEEELHEAKLSVLQQLDAPLPPAARAFTLYSWEQDGKTKEHRQAYRDRLLALTCEEVASAVKQQLLAQVKSSCLGLCSGSSLLEKENLQLLEMGVSFQKR